MRHAVDVLSTQSGSTLVAFRARRTSCISRAFGLRGQVWGSSAHQAFTHEAREARGRDASWRKDAPASFTLPFGGFCALTAWWASRRGRPGFARLCDTRVRGMASRGVLAEMVWVGVARTRLLM